MWPVSSGPYSVTCLFAYYRPRPSINIVAVLCIDSYSKQIQTLPEVEPAMQRFTTTTRFMVQLQAPGYFTATPSPPSNVTSHRNSTSEDSVARWMSEHVCDRSIAYTSKQTLLNTLRGIAEPLHDDDALYGPVASGRLLHRYPNPRFLRSIAAVHPKHSVSHWMSEHLCNKSIAPSCPFSHEHNADRDNPELSPLFAAAESWLCAESRERPPHLGYKRQRNQKPAARRIKDLENYMYARAKESIGHISLVYLRPRFYPPPFQHWRRKGKRSIQS